MTSGDESQQQPDIELIMVRGIDSSEYSIYVDGEPVNATWFDVDLRRHRDWDEWCDDLARNIAKASPNVAAALLEIAVNPPEPVENMPDDEDERRAVLEDAVNRVRNTR